MEVDLSEEWIIPEETQFCRSRWTPFAGRSVTGCVKRVVLGGEVVFIDGQVSGTPVHGWMVGGGGVWSNKVGFKVGVNNGAWVALMSVIIIVTAILIRTTKVTTVFCTCDTFFL